MSLGSQSFLCAIQLHSSIFGAYFTLHIPHWAYKPSTYVYQHHAVNSRSFAEGEAKAEKLRAQWLAGAGKAEATPVAVGRAVTVAWSASRSCIATKLWVNNHLPTMQWKAVWPWLQACWQLAVIGNCDWSKVDPLIYSLSFTGWAKSTSWCELCVTTRLWYCRLSLQYQALLQASQSATSHTLSTVWPTANTKRQICPPQLLYMH